MTWDRVFALALVGLSAFAARQACLDAGSGIMAHLGAGPMAKFTPQVQRGATHIAFISMWFWRIVTTAAGVGAGLLFAR